MKIEFDKKKGAAAVSSFMQNTKDLGKKVANNTKEFSEKVANNTKELSEKAANNARNSVSVMVEKSKSDSYARRMKKYNPIFPEQYESDDFNLPNMIVIVDDAVRRGIDVCEGAIGWLGNESGMEVLYLYDEAVDYSTITFVPAVACDAIYYVDSFDRKRFIRTDCIFTKAHEERLAELKNIAFALGAKKCIIEIDETDVDVKSEKKRADSGAKFKGVALKESVEQELSAKSGKKVSGHIEIEFVGSDIPNKPELKWFAHDDNIKRLIDMRCSNTNSIKTETLKLSGASSATMSQKTACAIDGALDKIAGVKASATMNAQASKEHQSNFVYIIEF